MGRKETAAHAIFTFPLTNFKDRVVQGCRKKLILRGLATVEPRGLGLQFSTLTVLPCLIQIKIMERA